MYEQLRNHFTEIQKETLYLNKNTNVSQDKINKAQFNNQIQNIDSMENESKNIETNYGAKYNDKNPFLTNQLKFEYENPSKNTSDKDLS